MGKNHNILTPLASFLLNHISNEPTDEIPVSSDDTTSISISAGLVIPPG